MEELRSTEILDKEIISDAEKKAAKISLKAAEECARIEASVQVRVEEEISKSEENLKLKLKNYERDLNASIPLEKSRFYISYIQESVLKNINEFLASVPEEKIISLLAEKSRGIDFKGLKVKAYVYGLDPSKSEKILKETIGNSLEEVISSEFNKIIYEESLLEVNKGIILISENSEIKCRFTLSQIVDGLLDKYRSELAEGLFGPKAE